jgi:hypothetical protein
MDLTMIYTIAASTATILTTLAWITYWLGGKFRKIDMRFTMIDERFKQIDERFKQIDERLARFADSISGALISINSLMIEYLGIKNVLTRDEAEFLKREITRWAGTIRANPISKEEIEYIKAVASKSLDEITLEEIDKVVEIAKRWWYEGGGEVAYRIFLYAYIVRTYIYFEKIRKEGSKGGQQTHT